MYAAMLAAADDAVGEIMATVKKMGQLDNTFVFFQADNGATREARAGLNGQPARGGSNGILRGWKFSLFDGGMHVPGDHELAGKNSRRAGDPRSWEWRSISCPPSAPPPALPLPADRTYDGRDICPWPPAAPNRRTSAIFWSSGGQLAVRRGKWKLVIDGNEFGPERKKLTGDDALFLSDLENDPGERTNLRHKEPALADELATMAKKWEEEVKKN